MVIGNFNNEFRFHRLPFRRSFGRPPAAAAWRVSGEAAVVHDGLKLIRQSRLRCRLEPGREPDMVQLALFIIEAQQERAYDFAPGSTPLSVPKTPNHAVRGADAFDLLHAFAIASLVGKIDAFGDDTIATTTGPSEPIS